MIPPSPAPAQLCVRVQFSNQLLAVYMHHEVEAGCNDSFLLKHRPKAMPLCWWSKVQTHF